MLGWTAVHLHSAPPPADRLLTTCQPPADRLPCSLSPHCPPQVTKKVTSPLPTTDNIFYAGTGMLLCRSEEKASAGWQESLPPSSSGSS